MKRWMRFYLIGGVGFALQIFVSQVLKHSGLHYMVATGLAVEAAVLHNFFWHQAWTWNDRQGSFFSRMLSFHATNGLLSILGNLLFVRVFVEFMHMQLLPATILAVGLCAIWNFLAADRIVFMHQ